MNTVINFDTFNTFPELRSERIYFRSFIFSDSPDLFSIRSNEQVMKFMDTQVQQDISEAEKMIFNIQESFENKSGINWAMINMNTHELMGYFGFWRLIPDACRAEIGFALKPEYQQKGFMSEAFETMIDFGFNNLKLHSIEANVNPFNSSCIDLLEKYNFKKEAHFRENWLFNGKYVDSIIYSLLESD